MVTISTIWDRTTEVLRGRAGMLATIAVLLILLPAAVQSAWAFSTGSFPTTTGIGAAPATPSGAQALGGLLGIVSAVLRLWGSLALVAAALSPDVQSVGEALGIGGRRLLPMIGATLLLVVAVGVLMIPFFALVASAMPGILASGRTGAFPAAGMFLHPGLFLFYFFAIFVILAWLLARLFVLVPVIVNERLGVGAFGRSLELTRGYTWRLVGVLLLFGIVSLVALFAFSAVLGLLGRLALGPQHILGALWLAQFGNALVSVTFSVIVSVFSAQFYRARTGWEVADTFA